MTATRRRALLVAVLVTGLAVTTTGVAFAYVTGSGSGTGSATTGTPIALVLSPATTPAKQLYPGGLAAVEGSVQNLNPFDVKVESVSLDIAQPTAGFAVDSSHAACGVDSLSFAKQTNGGLGWVIPGNTTLGYTLPGSLTMNASAANECQGATFTVYLKVGP